MQNKSKESVSSNSDSLILQKNFEYLLKQVQDVQKNQATSKMSLNQMEDYLYRMNQVMKTLTIVATIFMPLTFIAGIYGMNFVHMPELEWKYGYYGIWGIMIVLFCAMVLYFRAKKWF